MANYYTDYRLCSKELEQRIYKVTENAKLPKDLTDSIIRAGITILQSKPVHSRNARITANDLVDLLELLYAKTGPQFTPIITRLAHGALSVPEERLREWYAAARQIANFYTHITQNEQEKIKKVLENNNNPDCLLTSITALHHEEVRVMLQQHSSLTAIKRNGRISEQVVRTKSTWNTGKPKET